MSAGEAQNIDNPGRRCGMIAKQNFTGWLTTDRAIDLTTTIAATLGVLFVTITGIVLSYDALWDLAQAAGSINPALTWLWPLTLDALAVVASLNVLWAEIRQERDRYAWTLVIAFTLLSVLFNATHASFDQLLLVHPLAPVIVSGFVGILPPIAAAFALHLLVRLLRRVLERVSVMSSTAALAAKRNQLAAELGRDRNAAVAERKRLTDLIADLTAKADTLRTELDPLRKGKRQLNQANRPAGAETSSETEARAQAILAERYAAGEEPTGAELGRLLGKSDSLGRRLKRKLWPEVIKQASGTDYLPDRPEWEDRSVEELPLDSTGLGRSISHIKNGNGYS